MQVSKCVSNNLTLRSHIIESAVCYVWGVNVDAASGARQQVGERTLSASGRAKWTAAARGIGKKMSAICAATCERGRDETVRSRANSTPIDLHDTFDVHVICWREFELFRMVCWWLL